MNFEHLIKDGTSYVATVIEGFGGLIIALAALQGMWRSIAAYIFPANVASDTESIRLRLGRWLSLALEFELGADILRTAVAPTWNEIGQLGAIIVLRTLLNYFLQREIDAATARGEAPASQSASAPVSRRS